MSKKNKKRWIYLDADPLLFECTEGKFTKGTVFGKESGDVDGGGFKEPLKNYKKRFKQLVQDIEDEIAVNFVGEIKGIKVVISDPEKCFRYDIYPAYKGNRSEGDRGPLFYRLRTWALKHYGYTSPYSLEKLSDVYKIKKTKKKTKVWLDNKPLYDLYDNMIKRCYRKDSHSDNYKTSGIKVYNKWVNDKEKFFEWCLKNGYENGLQIDRIDNSWGYTPSNCQFITAKDNKTKQHLCDNRRNYIDYDLKHKAHCLKNDGLSMKQICKEIGVEYGNGSSTKKSKVQMRLDKSFSSDKGLFEYKKEEDWIASKLNEGVVFLLNKKEFIVKDGKAEYSFRLSGWEADDHVSHYVRKGAIGATMDKDMLRGVAGTWFDTYHSRRTVREVSEGEARNFNYIQTLMGDPTDNIKALPKKAGDPMIPVDDLPKGKRQPFKVTEKIACDILDEFGWNWEGVVKGFESRGFGEKEAELNRRLICLNQWTPKKGIKLFKSKLT